MLSEEQYQLAKEGLNDPDLTPAEKAGLEQAVAEYESAQQEQPVAAPSTESPAATSAAPEEAAAPPEPAAPDASAQVAAILGKDYGPPTPEAPEPSYIEPGPPPYGPPETPEVGPEDTPNASKLLRLNFPTEHKSKSRSALGVIAENMAASTDPLAGASSTMWFEPSREVFETAMGPYLDVHHYERGSPEYENAYQLYQDTKWKEAYQNAVNNDLPITRVAFDPGKTKWDQVSNFLGKSADGMSAFVEGVSRGYAGPSRGLAVSLHDKLTGRTDLDAMRERADRHPYIGAGGSLVGSILPGSLFGKVAGKVNALAKPATTIGKLGMAGLAGTAGADAELLANKAGAGVEDWIGGHPVDWDLADLPRQLGITSGLGFAGGVAGELVAKGAGALRQYFRSATSSIHPHLPNAEVTGSTTSAVSGLEPSDQVKAILDKARGPVPGEFRAPIMESAVEHAAAPAIEPIVNQQNRALGLAKTMLGAEKERYVRFDPVLKNQTIEPTNILDAIHDELVLRSKPTASGQTFPRPGDEVGAWNTNKKLFDTYSNLVRPEVHLATEVPPGALRGGSKIISVAQAREMGFDIQPPKIRQPAKPIWPPPPEITAPARQGAPLLNTPEMAPVSEGSLPTLGPFTRRDPGVPVNDSLPPPAGSLPNQAAANINDRAAAEHIPTQPSFTTPVPDTDPAATLKVPDFHPEDAYVVELKPIPMSPLKFESVVDSIDNAGNASSVKGAREQIWDDLIAVARKDRDKFKNGEWSRMYNRHSELLSDIKQRGKYAGIVEEAPYDKMSPGNRQVAEQTIKGYPTGSGETNQALAHLADVAGRVSGKDVRHDLEGIRAVRSYLDLKDKTSLASGLTTGGGPLGLGGLLPAGKIRLDAIARAVARDTQGNPLYVPPYNPEAAMGSLPPGRSLLPSAGLLAFGGGSLGVRLGAPIESATNNERARSTGSLDADQMRIIDEALRQHK